MRKRVVAVNGVDQQRRDLRVEILVVVPAGASARAAGNRALASEGAVRAARVRSVRWTPTGLRWNAFPVWQYYNPPREPTAEAVSALSHTYGTWSSVPRSSYSIASAGTAYRCPSLVEGCGVQRYDGANDVGWLPLAGGTLGVTWFGTFVDEADMAINTRYPWSTSCAQVDGAFDLETVYLHENGHVAGLGHSHDPNAVMYPSYGTARCALGEDDMRGIAAIY